MQCYHAVAHTMLYLLALDDVDWLWRVTPVDVAMLSTWLLVERRSFMDGNILNVTKLFILENGRDRLFLRLTDPTGLLTSNDIISDVFLQICTCDWQYSWQKHGIHSTFFSGSATHESHLTFQSCYSMVHSSGRVLNPALRSSTQTYTTTCPSLKGANTRQKLNLDLHVLEQPVDDHCVDSFR